MNQGQPLHRGPLTVQSILKEATALADEGGLAALSMRALGRRLGVEGMAVYHHFANKDALLDALVDQVFHEMALPEGPDWRAGLRARSVSERLVLRRHPWAIGLVESRTAPGPILLRVRISTENAKTPYLLEDPVVLGDTFRRYVAANRG